MGLPRPRMLAPVSDNPPIYNPAKGRQNQRREKEIDLKVRHSSSLPSISCAVICTLIPARNRAKASNGHNPAGGAADPYKKLAIGATIAVTMVATPVLLMAAARSFI